MSTSQLATSGDDFKIWDTQSYQPVHQYSSPLQPGSSVTCSITSNSWSADTSCVASVVRGRDRIVLSYNKNNKYNSQEIVTQGISTPVILQFLKTTQRNLLLSSGHELYIYDITKSKVKKSFAMKSSITSLTVNYCDAYVAVGCSNGSLNLATLATNQLSSPMVATKCSGQKITSVKYSSVKPSFLGSSCESGVLSFWDCNANKNLFNLTPHCAPATAITFSPINDTLALSVGLDKRLVCCDTKTRKVVMNIQCESPLTAADFDMNGVNMAVGTSRGKVLVYDLRSPKTPTQTLAAHTSSVSSLVYTHKLERQKSSQSQPSSAVKVKSKLSQCKSTPSLNTVEEETKENVAPANNSQAQSDGGLNDNGLEEHDFAKVDDSVFKDDSIVPSRRRDSLSSQLFSPLRENDSSFPSSQKGRSSVGEDRRVSEVRLSSDGLFSPLREVGSPASSITSLQLSFKRTPFTSFTTPTMSPLTSIREESTHSPSKSPSKPLLIGKRPSKLPEKLSLEKLDDFVKKASAGDKSPTFDIVESDGGDDGASFSVNNGDKLILVDEQQGALGVLGEEEAASIVKPGFSSVRSQPEDFLSVLTAFPDLGLDCPRQSPTRNLDRAASRLVERQAATPDSGVATFQKDYITGVVSDAMEEWCEGVERRLWGLQYSLLRQLQQHQDEIKVMVAESTKMEEMRKELTRLENENKELRKYFGTDPGYGSSN